MNIDAGPVTSALGRLLLLFATMAVQPDHADRRHDHHLLGTSMAWPKPYDPRDVIHSRFQMTRDGRVIVASPRFRPGVPFTLGTFRVTTASRAAVEPDVLPLPSGPDAHVVETAAAPSSNNNSRTPSPLVNVIDLWMDNKDVLWMLDVGVVDTMTDKPKRVAPAKIVRLDMDDEDDPKTYKTYEIKTGSGEGSARNINSCLQYIATFRSRSVAGGHYVFVSDAARSSVLVLDTDTGGQWSVDFPEMAMAADAPRDVMFMVVLRKADGRTALYVTFLSGCRVFAVDVEHIDACVADADRPRPPVVEAGRKPYKMTVLGSDADSRMYFRRPAENEIWSWDANDPFRPAAFRLVYMGGDCRAPAHVAPGYDGFLFVLKNNYADYVRNSTGSMGAYTIIEPVSVPPPPPPPPTTKKTLRRR